MGRRRVRQFDPSKARGGAPGPDVGQAQPPAGSMTVSMLLARLKAALCDALPGTVTVVGEISNCKLHTSGHLYFRLKDAASSIDAMMWRAQAARLKFRPTDGLEVVVEARIDIYEAQGRLQLYAQDMTPRGQGALELALRQLRERLGAEGLFDPQHKVPIPRIPRGVGVITSATGAAIRDIQRTIVRRCPGLPVYLLPALVQGEGAAADIARKIRLLDASAAELQIDTIIVGRGGGSLEDLWAFNEEPVARAIHDCRTPIISGVGHEVDFSIADQVADARAATPTAAAEMAVPSAEELLRQIGGMEQRLRRALAADVSAARAQLGACLRSVAFRDPTARLRSNAQRLDELDHRLLAGVRHLLAADRQDLEPLSRRLAALHPARLADNARARLDRTTHRLAWVLGGRSKRCGDQLAALTSRLEAVHPRHRLRLAMQQLHSLGRQLESMSHRSVLARGFSVTRGAGGAILRSVREVAPGQQVQTELADGRFASTVARSDTAPDPPPQPRKPRRTHRSDDQPTLF